jgi:hypothetical protein
MKSDYVLILTDRLRYLEEYVKKPKIVFNLKTKGGEYANSRF